MSITSNTSMIESNNSIIRTIKTKLQNYTPGSGGGGSVEGAKIFETVEQMNASSGNEVGDLAVVYADVNTNFTATTEAQVISFPNTVKLPSTVNSSYYGMMSSTGDMYFDGQVELTSNYFRFTGWGETASVEISYTSTDGKNYTKDYGDDQVDIGTPIKASSASDWNDLFGYFMQYNTKNFGGLFEYSSFEDKEFIQFRPWSDATIDWTNRTISFGNARLDGEYDIEKIRVCVEKACTDFGSDIYGQFVWLDEDGDICFWCLFNGSTYNKWCTNYMLNSDNTIKGVCYSTKTGWSSVDFRVYKLNLEEGTYSLKRSNVSYTTVGSYWVADIKPMCIPGSFSSNTEGIIEQSFTLVNSSGSTTIYSFVEKEAYPIRHSYVRVDA